MADAPAAVAARRRGPLYYRLTRRLFRIPEQHRGAVLEAVVALLSARFALVFTSFDRLAATFGTVTTPQADDGSRHAVLGPEQAQTARIVGWAVTRAARYVPFRAVCLPQAIAAMVLLKRRGIPSVMHFGVRKVPGKKLDAHAWLNAGEVEVTGYPVDDGFVEVARFL